MSEPKRVQVIRSHQTLDEFMFEKKTPATDATHGPDVFHQPDYHAVGFKRLHQLQSLPFAESWPIIVGNGVGSVSTGFVGESRASSAPTLCARIRLRIRALGFCSRSF